MKPWKQIHVPTWKVPTMLCEEERRYLYWLTNRWWQQRGHVVEIGPWLGGSTECLAAGLVKRQLVDCHWNIFVYDNFVWRSFMSQRVPLPLVEGESFYEFFKRYAREYEEVIECQKRSLPLNRIENDWYANDIGDFDPSEDKLIHWENGEPVEILFIDGAKSYQGLLFLLREFSDYLLPKHSLLVCQDYKYGGAYWIPLVFELLSEYMVLEHNIKGKNTVFFRLTKALSSERINELPPLGQLDLDQGAQLVLSASKRLANNGDRLLGALNVRTSLTRFFAHKGQLDRSRSHFRNLEAQWPWQLDDGQLDRARRWLSKQADETFCRTGRTKARIQFRRLARRIQRLLSAQREG